MYMFSKVMLLILSYWFIFLGGVRNIRQDIKDLEDGGFQVRVHDWISSTIKNLLVVIFAGFLFYYFVDTVVDIFDSYYWYIPFYLISLVYLISLTIVTLPIKLNPSMFTKTIRTIIGPDKRSFIINAVTIILAIISILVTLSK